MKIKRILLSLAVVFGLTSFGSVANAACGNITIANMNWASANFMAEVDKIILEEGYGCSVELVPGATMPTFTSMQEKGEPDVAPEFWANAAIVALNKAVDEGKMHTLNKAPITGLGEGWWVLPATLEKHPELTTADAILKRPDLFPHPEDPSKGAMMICPGGWSCQNQHINLFTAFDMEAKGWKLLDPGSGAGMDSAWQGAVAKEQALFGYYWSPTALVGSLGIVKLTWDTPYAGDDNWQNCIAQPADTCSDPLATAMPVAETGTVVVPEGLTIGVLGYLAKRKMPEGVTETMLVFGTENQASAEEMAIEFMKLYPEVWERWVSSKAAENIWATLE